MKTEGRPKAALDHLDMRNQRVAHPADGLTRLGATLPAVLRDLASQAETEDAAVRFEQLALLVEEAA